MSEAPLKRTTCPYCGVGCGLLVGADGRVTGDPDHPANRGRLCSKGAALGETLNDVGRLLQPEIGGLAGAWDSALDLIAAAFTRTIAEHGPDSVAFYVSGQFLTEDYYVANKLMKGFIGSANIDTNSRLCMASSVAGHVRAFGEDIVPGCYDDLEFADLVVLVGSNLAWCHPVLYQRLAAARDGRGTKIVVVDPRRTATCEIADLHLALRPGSDVALFSGLLVHLARTFKDDRALEALEAARDDAGSVAQVAALTDLAADQIAHFYSWFAATARTVTCYSQGVNQSSAGTDKVNAIINCHLLTGRIGHPGMGPMSLTGQPNAMGGREVGGLANQLAAHMAFDDADIDRVRRFWSAPRLATRPGLKAVELFDAMLNDQVKAVWILNTNPADSMPRASRVREALSGCRFVVASDCWATETTRLAHVVLPAAGWGEKDGTITNSERCISRQRAFRKAPGEARPDWWMMSEVARRMGWRLAFPYRHPAEIFREHAALSAFENDGRRLFDIGALADITDDAYEGLQPVQWPLPRGRSTGASRVFEQARAKFVPTRHRPLAQPVSAEWPLVLNTGRVRDQWHTMTRTGRVPHLMTHQGLPFLDIHPADAGHAGLVKNGLARVESRHGSVVLPVRLSTDQRPGEVFVPMHWGEAHWSSGPIAQIVDATTDPVSGQPELKGTPVRVASVAVTWRGLMLRARPGPMKGTHHWARSPVDGGDMFELWGEDAPPCGERREPWIRQLLDAPSHAEFTTHVDSLSGASHYASIVSGKPDACLCLAADAGALPERSALISALGSMAGLTNVFQLHHEEGPIVCACHGVGASAIADAIRTRHLTTVAEIGAALRAGTNCGSCVPELKKLLRETFATHPATQPPQPPRAASMTPVERRPDPLDFLQGRKSYLEGFAAGLQAARIAQRASLPVRK